jgi:hypothetical protein
MKTKQEGQIIFHIRKKTKQKGQKDYFFFQVFATGYSGRGSSSADTMRFEASKTSRSWLA